MAIAHLRVHDKVRIHCPENQRLHGAFATVIELTDWGAHVSTQAAATGRYRAHWSELLLSAELNGHARQAGYDGDPCPACGALTLRRNGACLLCDSCGSTTGCS